MTLSQPTWQEVLAPLFERYANLLALHQDIVSTRLNPDVVSQALRLSRYAPAHLHEIDEGKANRWLGYIQGIVIAGGLTTVAAEREYTRPLFHALKGPSPSHDA